MVKEYPFTTDAELKSAIDLADKTYREIQSQPIAERAGILHNVAAKFREHADELAKICTIDMGKLIGESKGEVERTQWLA